MARIPAAEIDRLKLSVSVLRLVEAAGIALKPHGKDWVGRCPFHDDKTPSLVISPKSNLWHCLGACQMGGSVVDWVMKYEGVSFRRAVELLRREIGVAPLLDASVPTPVSMLDTIERSGTGGGTARVRFSRLLKQESSVIASADDQAQLNRVIDYYHATLKQSPEAHAYLEKRGLASAELVDRFKLGFANRTLGYRLPEMQVKSGAAVRGALQRIGILRGTGHEHFNGSLVVPVFDAAGVDVLEVYGRKVTARLREGTPLHLYLPGPHRGVFNEAGLVGQEEVILCEALIDALTFWAAGYRNVTASYGVEGFTADHLAAFRRHGVQRVLIAYDRDAAGDAAAAKLAAHLMVAGFECYRVLFPQGMDANAYALSVKSASVALGLCIRQAEWIGKGAAPVRELLAIVDAPSATPLPELEPEAPRPTLATSAREPSAEVVAASEPAPSVAVLAAALPAVAVVPADVAPAFALPPLPSPPTPEVTERDVVLTLGDRRYRVRGLDKNLAYDVLKVNLLVSRGAGLHVDTFDLYQAKARALFVRLASTEIGVEEAVLQRDLGQLLLALEQQQDALIQRRLRAAEGAAPSAPAPLAAEDEAAALALLCDPQLIERIVADFERCGLVGEPSNALVGYLAAVSRKLAAPLAILVQSTSAAGKSALMDAVLRLMPEHERVHYSAMTGQSLFYLGEKDLKHKILAIAEEEGVRQASYALKLLQSQGELTIASTGKDPVTGQLITQEYRVEGPVMLFLTTTAIDVDEELLNRCLVLTIDESREQTRAIQQRQRVQRTLAGLLADAEAEAVMTLHRNAQQLLRPLAVVNPYADRLGFLDERTRTRRDHQKYLTLIDAIAYLHQHQREVRTVAHRGRRIDYIEVVPADIALANRLAHEVLGRSLDELPAQTRRLLGVVRAYVAERCAALVLRQTDLRFTRRELRERAGLSEAQLRVHLERLVELEYLLPHRGQRGQSFVYELIFDGEVDESAPRLLGLIDIEALESVATTKSSRGQSGEFAGSSRPHRGGLAAGSRAEENPPNLKPDAACAASAVSTAKAAAPRPLNGAHQSPVVVPAAAASSL
jgi:hypothetical protein